MSSTNQQQMKGSIKLIIGPMFSQKSTSMCEGVERYRIANKLCVIVKYSRDTRYDHLAKNGGIVTHAGYEHCKCPVVTAQKLAEVFDEISEYEVIGIDEIQFFEDCVEIVETLANMGKIMICAGLDGDCKQKPFGRVLELIPYAEDVVKLKAVCMHCCDDASFTKRIISDDIQGGGQIDIGGADKYISVCRQCLWSNE